MHVADAMEFMVVSSTAEKVETTIDVRATFDKIDRAWYQTVHKSKLAALITPSTRACSMARTRRTG